MAATTSKANVGKVKIAKVDRKVLVKFATQLKVGTAEDKTEDLVAALVAKFAKLPANRIAECTECDGDSDKELECCPFCGEGDDDASASASASDDEDEDESESASASDDEDESESASDDQGAATDETSASTDAGVATASTDPSMDDDPEVVAEQNARLKENGTPSTLVGAPRKVTDEEKKNARKKKDGEALATTDAHVAEIVPTHTEKDLNDAVERVLKMKGEVGVSLWKLGQEIGHIYETQMWKQRNAESGAPAYKSFNVFVQRELQFTANTAYWLMDISKNYNEAQINAYGTTKLGHLLAAPKDARAKIMGEIEKGASVSEVKEMVKEAREEAGEPEVERDTGRRKKPAKKGARKGGNKPKKTREPTITVAALTGKQTVKLWKGPVKKGQEPDARAKKLGDQPWGVVELENKVHIYIRIVASSAGDLEAKLDIRREE